MNNPSLSRVTLQSLENYRAAAAQAVVAYRLGGHRLVSAVNGALQNTVYPQTAKLAPRATDRLDEVRGNVSEIVVKGIDQVAQRADQAIELSSSVAAKQVTKVAQFAAGIDNQMVAGGLQAAARLSLPGAQVALVVSSRVAEGAKSLASAAGARPVRQAVRKAAKRVQRQAAPVVRQAKADVKAVSKRVVKAAKSVKLNKSLPVPLVKAQRGLRQAKKAVTKAVAA